MYISKAGTLALIRVAQGKHPDHANMGRISSMVPFEFDPGLEQHLSDLAFTKRTFGPEPSAPMLSSRLNASSRGSGVHTGSNRLAEMAARIRAKEAETRAAQC